MRFRVPAVLLLLLSSLLPACGGEDDEEKEAPPGCEFRTTEIEDTCLYYGSGPEPTNGVRTVKVERLCCGDGTECETTKVTEGRCRRS